MNVWSWSLGRRAARMAALLSGDGLEPVMSAPSRLFTLSVFSLVVAVLAGVVTNLLVPAPALAAPVFVQELGTHTAAAIPLTSITLTTSGAVTPGNSIIVTLTFDLGVSGALTIACTDDASNTYQTDIVLTNPFQGHGVAICSAHGVAASPTIIT